MKKHEELGQEPSSPTPFYNGDELYCDNNGFTKREAIAMRLMAAELQARQGWVDGGYVETYPIEECAKQAVMATDALLKELSNE